MRLSELKRLVAIWQERLSLLDWNLKVRFATPEEAEENWAHVSTHVHQRSGEIYVGNPDDWSEEDKADPANDIDVFVVHELVHCHLATLEAEADTPRGVVEENIAWAIARLLVAAFKRDDRILGRKLSRRASLSPKTVKPRTTKQHTLIQEETNVSKEGS